MPKLINRNIYILFIATLLWPFLALCLSLAIKRRVGIFAVLFFSVLWYGLTFSFSNEKLDSWVYAQALTEMKGYSFDYFIDYYVLGYFQHEKTLDLYQQTLTFILSKVGFSSQGLFAIFSLVIFYCQYRTFSIININGFRSTNQKIIFFSLIFLCIPIFYVNGVRFYTASWFFILGVVGLYFRGSKVYLFSLLLSVLTHYSFIIAICLIPFYSFFLTINKRLVVCFILMSFFLGKFGVMLVNSVVNTLPIGLASRASRYVTDEYVTHISESASSGNILVYLGGEVINITLTLIYIHLSWSFFYLFTNFSKVFNRLWSLCGVMLCFSLLISEVPSMQRFNAITEFFILLLIYCLSSINNDKGVKLQRFYIWLLAPALLLKGIVVARLAIDVIGIHFFLPLPLINLIENTSLLTTF